jgi:hypothetical protein
MLLLVGFGQHGGYGSSGYHGRHGNSEILIFDMQGMHPGSGLIRFVDFSIRFHFWFTDCAIGDLRSTNCAIGGIPLLGLTHRLLMIDLNVF